MRRTPNRIRITPNYRRIERVSSEVDEAMKTGARTAESVYLARFREYSLYNFRSAWLWEEEKRLSKSLTGSYQAHMLCGHEV